MKAISSCIKALSLCVMLGFCSMLNAQTLNIKVGSVTYLFPASAAGDITFTDGTTLTVMNKNFTIADITEMYVDETAVSLTTVDVVYSASSATVVVAGDIAEYLSVSVNGSHVAIMQDDDVATEITYNLSGTSSNGSFYTSGSYKITLALNSLSLTCADSAAINIRNGKRIALAIEGTNTLVDGKNGSQNACLSIKGHPEVTGSGTLTLTGNTKHALKTNEYMQLKKKFTGSIIVKSAVSDGMHIGQYLEMNNGTITISGVGDDGLQVEATDDTTDEQNGEIIINGGTLTVTATATGAKAIKCDSDMTITDGVITARSEGSNENSSSGGGGRGWAPMWGGPGGGGPGGGGFNPGGNDSSSGGNAKGIKATGAIYISGGVVNAYSANHEGLESKSTITISGGQVFSQAKDDAINSANDMTITGGYVCGYSTGNDGLDANGNCYIKGGTVYAIGSTSPELGIDANTEKGYKLYVSGGTIVAIGGLESGSSLTQTCYSTSSWSKSTWYALYSSTSDVALVFKTPASGGTTLVVSTGGTTSLKSGVTVSGGTSIFGGMANIGATISGGTTITNLSTYTSSGRR